VHHIFQNYFRVTLMDFGLLLWCMSFCVRAGCEVFGGSAVQCREGPTFFCAAHQCDSPAPGSPLAKGGCDFSSHCVWVGAGQD